MRDSAVSEAERDLGHGGHGVARGIPSGLEAPVHRGATQLRLERARVRGRGHIQGADAALTIHGELQRHRLPPERGGRGRRQEDCPRNRGPDPARPPTATRARSHTGADSATRTTATPPARTRTSTRPQPSQGGQPHVVYSQEAPASLTWEAPALEAGPVPPEPPHRPSESAFRRRSAR